MTPEDRAALIAEIRAATIAECQRTLRDSADAVERVCANDVDLGWAARVQVIGYRASANLLETMKSPQWAAMERAS